LLGIKVLAEADEFGAAGFDFLDFFLNFLFGDAEDFG
jgi:hypothetical protein